MLLRLQRLLTVLAHPCPRRYRGKPVMVVVAVQGALIRLSFRTITQVPNLQIQTLLSTPNFQRPIFNAQFSTPDLMDPLKSCSPEEV